MMTFQLGKSQDSLTETISDGFLSSGKNNVVDMTLREMSRIGASDARCRVLAQAYLSI